MLYNLICCIGGLGEERDGMGRNNKGGNGINFENYFAELGRWTARLGPGRIEPRVVPCESGMEMEGLKASSSLV